VSEATIRAALVATIDAVDNTGTVVNREPWASTWDAFLDIFKVTIDSVDMIRGFTVSMETMPQEGLVTTGARYSSLKRDFTYRIRGYNGVSYANSSEINFLTVIIAVIDALDQSSLVALPVINALPAQLEIYEPRMFGGLLCHYAEITQVVSERT